MHERRKTLLFVSVIILLALVALVEGVFLMRSPAHRHGWPLSVSGIFRSLIAPADVPARAEDAAKEDIVVQETAEDLERMQNQIDRLFHEMTRDMLFVRGNMRSAGPEPAHFPFEDSYPGEDWVRRLQAEIGRIFQMAYASRHSGALNLIDRDWRDVGEMPSVNMRQEETNYVVSISMPGVDKAGINVSLNGRVLKIEAGMERRTTEQNAQAISSGRFQTQIMLPDDIVGEAARAVYENSILKITIPRKTDGNSLARKVVIM